MTPNPHDCLNIISQHKPLFQLKTRNLKKNHLQSNLVDVRIQVLGSIPRLQNLTSQEHL